jgi:hypothetical protein
MEAKQWFQMEIKQLVQMEMEQWFQMAIKQWCQMEINQPTGQAGTSRVKAVAWGDGAVISNGDKAEI